MIASCLVRPGRRDDNGQEYLFIRKPDSCIASSFRSQAVDCVLLGPYTPLGPNGRIARTLSLPPGAAQLNR